MGVVLPMLLDILRSTRDKFQNFVVLLGGCGITLGPDVGVQ